jgi:ribonuclease R
MAKKKEKKAGKRMKKSEMSERLISLFHTKPNETFSLKQLSSSLNLTTHPLRAILQFSRLLCPHSFHLSAYLSG